MKTSEQSQTASGMIECSKFCTRGRGRKILAGDGTLEAWLVGTGPRSECVVYDLADLAQAIEDFDLFARVSGC